MGAWTPRPCVKGIRVSTQFFSTKITNAMVGAARGFGKDRLIVGAQGLTHRTNGAKTPKTERPRQKAPKQLWTPCRTLFLTWGPCNKVNKHMPWAPRVLWVSLGNFPPTVRERRAPSSGAIPAPSYARHRGPGPGPGPGPLPCAHQFTRG